MDRRIDFIVLALVTGAIAIALYHDQPLYLCAFCLLGVLVAALLAALAMLFARRLTPGAFLLVWGLVLGASTSAEAWGRLQNIPGVEDAGGVLPLALTSATHLRLPTRPAPASTEVAPAATSSMPAVDPADPISDPALKDRLSTLVVAELCNGYDLETLRLGYPSSLFTPVPTLASGDDIREGEMYFHKLRESQATFRKILDDEVRNYQYAADLGRRLITNSNDPNKQLALKAFSDGEARLIDSHQSRNALLEPQLKVTEQLLDLALAIKAQGNASEENKSSWASLAAQYADYNSPAYTDSLPNMLQASSDARTRLGHLIEQTLFYDPHLIEGDYRCTATLPGNIDPEQTDAYVESILARWQPSAPAAAAPTALAPN